MPLISIFCGISRFTPLASIVSAVQIHRPVISCVDSGPQVTKRVCVLWIVSQNLPSTYSVTYILNVHPTEFGYNGSQSRKSLNLSNTATPIPGSTPIVTRLPYPEFGAAGIQFLKADSVR